MPDAKDVFWVDRTDRGRLRLTGRDRQSFLQGMVTNDVARLNSGGGVYAFQCDATGHVLADMRILCAEDHLLLDVEPGFAPQVAATLEKYLIMERCRITDVSGETAQIFIGGADAPTFLESFLGTPGISEWIEGSNTSFKFEGSAGIVAATRLISGPGFDLYLPDFAARDRLTALLAELDVPSLRPEDLEPLRIEAGIPRFGIDIDSRVLAPETSQRNRAISYRKGCYIGQEIVARIDARGHTNRVFTGFRLASGTDLPPCDTPVFDADGKEIGRVTSAAFAPGLRIPVGLGYIRNEHAVPDSPVTIEGKTAAVASLPFASEDSPVALAAAN